MQEHATTMQHHKLGYSVRELSGLVGVCERKIHYEIKEGRLSISRIGRRIVIRANEIDRWLKESEAE